MENPSTWTPIQKKIHLALRTNPNESAEVNRNRGANAVVAVLKAHELLKDGVDGCQLKSVIEREIIDWTDDVARGICGVGVVARVYNKLRKLNVLMGK